MRRLSRIGLRLLAFNLLVAFVPVAGVLYLDVYEARLLQAQEATLIDQARLLAAAVGDSPVPGSADLAALFGRLEQRPEIRFRMYDSSGLLIADTARHGPGERKVESSPYAAGESVRGRQLYRLGAWLAQIARALRSWLRPSPSTASPVDLDVAPPEVQVALRGRYGAAARLTPGQRSLTLFSGVPILRDGTVTGVVVASQSTHRLLSALYAVRLRLFQIVLVSFVAAILLTAFAAMTIVRPLSRLRRQAADFAERRGPLPESFAGAGRRDEIGALARALGELARRANEHVRLLQSFSADVSHELKNPLAAIRTAAELMADSDSAEERQHFLDLMTRDVARLERLVSGLREVAQIEKLLETDRTEPVALGTLLRDLVATRARETVRLELRTTPSLVMVMAAADRLEQVFDNLLANAVSFAPDGSTVRVALTVVDGSASVTIEDDGPGIPEAHLDRVFERFFTYRPGTSRTEHVGLGLAIARQVLQGYGGTIRAQNRPTGGASFVVTLPILRAGLPSN